MSKLGADPAALRRLAREMTTASEHLAAARRALRSTLGSTTWHGADAHAFRAAWDGEHQASLAQVADALERAAQTLHRQAADQDRASADAGGGAGATPLAVVGGGGGGGGHLVTGVFAGLVPAGPPAGVTPPGDAPGEPGGAPFVVGPPTRPTIAWDEDFVYDAAEPSLGDRVDWAEWGLKATAAHLHPGLQDAADFYSHYRDNTGTPMEFDYDAAYDDDAGVRAAVDDEISRVQAGVEDLVGQGAGAEFSVTGDAHVASRYPETENWQKTIGGHQQWSSADVSVDGEQVTMTVTVHGEDHYNFNRGQADIASGTPDDVNGRFAELGWAKPFDSSGTVTRTVTWTLGDAAHATVTKPEEGR